MATLVVDASIVLAILLPDESDSRADVAIEMLSSSGAVAPSSWPLEVANGLLRAHRRRRIDAALVRKGLEEMALLPVALDAENNRLAWTTIADLAARYRLTTYDAAYLELALRSGLPLATLDNDLYFVAKKARVSVVG